MGMTLRPLPALYPPHTTIMMANTTFSHRDNPNLFLCHYGTAYKFFSIAQGAGTTYPIVTLTSKYQKRQLFKRIENPEILNEHNH